MPIRSVSHRKGHFCTCCFVFCYYHCINNGYTILFSVKEEKIPGEKQKCPYVAVTNQDKEFTLTETNPLAIDVKEGAYEDVTTDHNVSLGHTEVQSQMTLYVNVPDSNISSDGYMVSQNVNKDDKSHVYTELMMNN